MWEICPPPRVKIPLQTPGSLVLRRNSRFWDFRNIFFRFDKYLRGFVTLLQVRRFSRLHWLRHRGYCEHASTCRAVPANRVKSKRALVVFRTFIPPPEFQPAWSVPPPLNLDERSYSLSSLLSIYQLSHQVEFCRFWFRCALFLFEIMHLFILFLDFKKNIYEKFKILFNLYILLLWYTSKFIVHRPSNGESGH